MSTRDSAREQIARRLLLAAIKAANDVLVEAKQEVKDEIPFEGISRLLPFPTETVAGYNHNHIRSLYAFDVETEKRTIREGDTLCGRKSSVYFKSADTNCAGCEAIGKGLALRDIL
jgi:hypothetical protein